MIFIGFVGLCVYIYLKKSPQNSKEFFANANGYIKYLPVDRQTTSMLAPIIDFTGKAIGDSINSNYKPVNQNQYTNLTSQQKKILTGSKSTKRSVSETKKKYVASQQGWKCQNCNNQLDATYEVDHKIDLQFGGSNHVSNLRALCVGCHKKKGMMQKIQ